MDRVLCSLKVCLLVKSQENVAHKGAFGPILNFFPARTSQFSFSSPTPLAESHRSHAWCNLRWCDTGIFMKKICWTLLTICLANYITAKQPPEHDQEATALILSHNKIFFSFEVLHKKTIAPIVHLCNRATKTTTKWGWVILSTQRSSERGCKYPS